MFNVVFAIIGLFFYGGIIKSMEMQSMEIQPMEMQPMDMPEVALECLQRLSRGSRGTKTTYNHLDKSSIIADPQDNVKKYMMQGIEQVTINGNCGNVNAGRIQLKITQITDDNVLEEDLTIHDKSTLSYIFWNREEDHLEIGLRVPHQMVQSISNIALSLALKKCAKIVTTGHVDTTFLSPLQSEDLQVKVASGATVQLPFINAKKAELFVEGAGSLLNMQDNALLKVDELLCIDREGNSKINLAINTKLLQARSNGNGEMRLQGVATEQELVIRDGSFSGLKLHNDRIRMAQGAGSGKIEVRVQESIKGYVSAKSQYDTTYRVFDGDGRRIVLSLLKDVEWNARFENSDKTIAFKELNLLLLK